MIRALEYSTKHISGPAAEPVTIEEVKRALELLEGNNFDETDLMRKAAAARREAEGILGKRVGEQVWDVILDAWPCYSWRLPIEPINSIVGVYATDSDGEETTVDGAAYAFSPATGRLWLKSGQQWPAVELSDFGAVRIRLNVGILPPGNEDAAAGEWQAIREAILFRVGTFNAFREDMTAGTTLTATKVGTFEALLGCERNITI